jgi:SNF2 family DNA or RNA helicase
MLLLHPQGGGHGLNLQYGGHHLVFFDIPWSLELYLQTIGRLDRQGQLDAVVLHHMIVKGTIDEFVVECLREKRDLQEALFRYIKRVRRDSGYARFTH